MRCNGTTSLVGEVSDLTPFHRVWRVAVAGFLRDDGTAVCKRNDWKLDELALYKAQNATSSCISCYFEALSGHVSRISPA